VNALQFSHVEQNVLWQLFGAPIDQRISVVQNIRCKLWPKLDKLHKQSSVLWGRIH